MRMDDLDLMLPGPAAILPEQFKAKARCGARESAIHRLMLGILRDAVELFFKATDPTSRIPARHRREVLAWFSSRDRRWIFSFERICDALGLDSSYLRRGLSDRARLHALGGGGADRPRFRPDGLRDGSPSYAAAAYPH